MVWMTAVVMLDVLWLMAATVGNEYTTVNGIRYSGFEAVEKDREITMSWEGTLTMEKLLQILDRYGMADNPFPDDSSTRKGNWASRYATDLLTDYRRNGDGSANFLDSETLLRMEHTWVENRPYFTYMGASDMLLEIESFSNVGLLLLVILGIAPVFAEEYSKKTADLIRTTAQGKGKDLYMRIAASCAFADLLLVFVNGLMLVLFLAVYGMQVLKADARLAGFSLGFEGMSFWQAWLYQLVWGMLAVIMMTAISLVFSAKCRSAFSAMIASAVCMFAGYLLNVPIKMYLPFRALKMICAVLGGFSPFFLVNLGGYGIPFGGTLWRLLYVLSVTVACLFAAGRLWKRRERS